MIFFQILYSEKLYYYPSKEYTSSVWLSKDKTSLEKQIKLCTKSLDRCCISLDARNARAFSVCRIPLTKDGTLGTPRYDVKLISPNPYRTNYNIGTFYAQGWYM